MKGVFKWLAGSTRGVAVARAGVAILAALGAVDGAQIMLVSEAAECVGALVAG